MYYLSRHRPSKPPTHWSAFDLLVLFEAIIHAGAEHVCRDGLPADDDVIRHFYRLRPDLMEQYEPVVVHQMYRRQVQRSLVLGQDGDWVAYLFGLVLRLVRSPRLSLERQLTIYEGFAEEAKRLMHERLEPQIRPYLTRWLQTQVLRPVTR
ncbi:hypothetical protein GMRT_11567 [Giardia muris]|uniref:Uncharacterized protein n=1 Tax=Giardia muris TaxID=5742 RepID=A0A4Z1T035_GIAMU|nr:hypothetical protein GMRT_11567 [Giardia muris]|eukprot:TNJ30345.1 hypothetical protein GMRT_11567 [Giardia muris]